MTETRISKPWVFSFTQLSMWNLCKRKYHDVYVLGHKEPTTPNMAFGTWMLHEPIEWWIVEGDLPNMWGTCWANFLAECGESEAYDDPIFNLTTALKLLEVFKRNGVQGQVIAVEEPYTVEFPGGFLFKSKPDLVVEQVVHDNSPIQDKTSWVCCATRRTTIDFKLKTVWRPPYGGWPEIPRLLKHDDQCLSQAIAAGANAFGRLTFLVDKKSGDVKAEPIYEEHAVDPVLASQWKAEAFATMLDIERYRNGVDPDISPTWPKNSASCLKYGKEKPCHRLIACETGA